MNSLKKILAFVNGIVFVLGVGCIGYLFHYDKPFFAVINLAILAQAYPFVREQWKRLNEGEV